MKVAEVIAALQTKPADTLVVMSSDGEGNILQTVETAIRDWHVNHIRLPLAQDRWFGKASEQKDDGTAYRALVRETKAFAHR